MRLDAGTVSIFRRGILPSRRGKGGSGIQFIPTIDGKNFRTPVLKASPTLWFTLLFTCKSSWVPIDYYLSDVVSGTHPIVPDPPTYLLVDKSAVSRTVLSSRFPDTSAGWTSSKNSTPKGLICSDMIFSSQMKMNWVEEPSRFRSEIARPITLKTMPNRTSDKRFLDRRSISNQGSVHQSVNQSLAMELAMIAGALINLLWEEWKNVTRNRFFAFKVTY